MRGTYQNTGALIFPQISSPRRPPPRAPKIARYSAACTHRRPRRHPPPRCTLPPPSPPDPHPTTSLAEHELPRAGPPTGRRPSLSARVEVVSLLRRATFPPPADPVRLLGRQGAWRGEGRPEVDPDPVRLLRWQGAQLQRQSGKVFSVHGFGSVCIFSTYTWCSVGKLPLLISSSSARCSGSKVPLLVPSSSATTTAATRTCISLKTGPSLQGFLLEGQPAPSHSMHLWDYVSPAC
ncbi:uncharacterized protein [Triticum aestivum]|uniref:uncharacterized protein isoform X1 n=1 Tax=Triticum aestivum TaxID=4565 RepID=UPI001D0203B3|nr:uncharacterized protein LOC123046942 isoform X1 [Triticum aestivum]